MTTNQKKITAACIWLAALTAEMAVCATCAFGVVGLTIVLSVVSLIAMFGTLSKSDKNEVTAKALGEPASSVDKSICRLLAAMGFGDRDATSRLLAVSVVVLRLAYRFDDKSPKSPKELLGRLNFDTLSEKSKDIEALEISRKDVQEVRLRCVAVPDLQHVLTEGSPWCAVVGGDGIDDAVAP